MGRQLIVDDVVIDYNATLLPDNLLRNPDVDSPQLGSASAPSFWHRSTNATWSDDVALSPTHSLELQDNSIAGSHEWRSYATSIPDGEDRTLNLRWFWDYDIEQGHEFKARLRLSDQPVAGADLISPTTEFNFTISGTSTDFEIFENSLAIADAVRSFDLTFISGGMLNAVGSINIDDISVALASAIPLSGDYNNDGVVDTADYVVWRKNEGSQAAYDAWRANFGASRTVSVGADKSPTAVPESASLVLSMLAALSLGVSTRSRRATFCFFRPKPI
jgi:hypothetical protein